MATVNFYLNVADRKGNCPIMMVYQDKGKKFKYYTKQKVKKKAWNGERVKMNYSDAGEINSILDGLENIIKGIEREAIFQKRVYPIDTVKKKFYLQLGQLTPSNDFFKSFNVFVEESKATKAPNTLKSYLSTGKRLMGFQMDKGITVSFEGITNAFYDSFVNYLIEDIHLLNNSVGKHIKNLKAFLNYAMDNEYTGQINLKKFKVLQEEAQTVYLTEQELLRLHYLAGLNDRLSHVRDNFCFGCFTGLRFSDIQKLNKSNFKEDTIEIRTDKTKGFLKIPLNDYALEILKRNEGKFKNKPLPPGISNQKTNQYIKELGQKAAIMEDVEMEKYTGSLKVLVKKKKYELLSSHTARRTFVTLALEKGIRPEIVMAMTGHSNYNTFKKYIKITDTIKQTEMKRLWSKQKLSVVK